MEIRGGGEGEEVDANEGFGREGIEEEGWRGDLRGHLER